MCIEGNNYIAPKWAREEREINSGSTTETLHNCKTSEVIQQYFTINNTNTQIHRVSQTKHKLHYLTICNVTLGRSQQPTISQTKFQRGLAESILRSAHTGSPLTADCLHSQDYLTVIKGFKFQGQLQGQGKRFPAQAGL
jgi:hypothetical protein